MTLLERISGASGSYLVSNTSANVREFEAFVVNTDCVVSSLLLDGTNAVSSMGLSSQTLTTGMIIFAPSGKAFTSITLTSGSVILY